jgi:pimeloyl-ACP methyl ester carboxylesterase
VELSLLASLTAALRGGEISAHIPVPKKVIHVGHSWGSQLSNALAASPLGSPLSDGLILTGYGQLLTYHPLFLASTAFHFASTNQLHRFRHRSSGYLTWGDQFANQCAFFAYPHFSPVVLKYAEAAKYPFGVWEFISQSALDNNAASYTRPVLYLEGQYDLIYCGDDCEGGILGPKSEAVTTINAGRVLMFMCRERRGMRSTCTKMLLVLLRL